MQLCPSCPLDRSVSLVAAGDDILKCPRCHGVFDSPAATQTSGHARTAAHYLSHAAENALPAARAAQFGGMGGGGGNGGAGSSFIGRSGETGGGGGVNEWMDGSLDDYMGRTRRDYDWHPSRNIEGYLESFHTQIEEDRIGFDLTLEERVEKRKRDKIRRREEMLEESAKRLRDNSVPATKQYQPRPEHLRTMEQTLEIERDQDAIAAALKQVSRALAPHQQWNQAGGDEGGRVHEASLDLVRERLRAAKRFPGTFLGGGDENEEDRQRRVEEMRPSPNQVQPTSVGWGNAPDAVLSGTDFERLFGAGGGPASTGTPSDGGNGNDPVSPWYKTENLAFDHEYAPPDEMPGSGGSRVKEAPPAAPTASLPQGVASDPYLPLGAKLDQLPKAPGQQAGKDPYQDENLDQLRGQEDEGHAYPVNWADHDTTPAPTV